MMVTAHVVVVPISPHARTSYVALSTIGRRTFFGSARQQQQQSGSGSGGQYSRSDFSNQGFTGIYEPGQPTAGPLGAASNVGAPRITPRMLKHHLDQFVVGQDRAKKTLSSAVYNHYQRVRELKRLEAEQLELEAQAHRREMGHRHPVEDEFPAQQVTVKVQTPSFPAAVTPTPSEGLPLLDTSPLQLEKSNVMLFGPSGVGKTLMAKTLARVLDVPFSMSDCTPFTQAGYIGQDAEVCVERLLSAANYDVAAAERGIICLDEIDKISTAKVSHGKDVSGEGVQQALLKIIEGTTLQFQAKAERGSAGKPSGVVPGNMGGSLDRQGTPGAGNNPPTQGTSKGEVFNVRTDNILFICTGAFVGLQKLIRDRISKGSIGFGATVRAAAEETAAHETMMKGEEALFKKHLPFFIHPEPVAPFDSKDAKPQQQYYNILDLVTPSDLQKYGMIPELVGRVPIHCALSALDEEALVRVLTEPRNSLLKQKTKEFQLSGIELKFTSGALRQVAKTAMGMGTGARGLKTVLERLLEEANFETPGSPTKHILITEAVAQLKSPPLYFARGQAQAFNDTFTQEEEEWQRRISGKKPAEEPIQSFEEYRRRGSVSAAGGFM